MVAPAPAVLLPESAGGVEVVARFFRALGDPARLRLLEFLLGCGYVEGRRDGRFTRYQVADPRVADLVVLARSMAADNAAALAACVHIPSAPDGGA